MSLPHPPSPTKPPGELGVFGAAMMGLGSIIGTGVFVCVGIAAGWMWWRGRGEKRGP